MFERKLPQDPIALRQLAEERWRQNPAPMDAAPATVGELQLQNIELRLQIEELQRVNDLLTAAVNCTPEAMYIKDREGKYLLVNEAATNYAGRSCEQILGHDDSVLFESETAAKVMLNDRAIMKRGQKESADQELTIGGRKHVYWTVKTPLLDAQGNVVGVVGSSRDVTEFKEIEAAHRENEARLAEAQEIGGLGSFEVDLATWRGRCSPALCKIFGFENDEPFHDFLGFLQQYRHPDDHEKSDTTRAVLLAHGSTDEVEHRYLHPDGRERILHVRRRAVRNSEDVAIKLVGTVQDVTERRRSEEQLRASEARYRTFVEHVTDAMFVHGDDGTVLDVNQRACDSLGYSREELIGKLPAAFDPDATPEFMTRTLGQLRENRSVSFESRHRRRDGAIFPVEIRVRPFWVDGKRFSVSLAHDITHRRESELQIRESEQRLRELADAIPQIVWTAGPEGGLLHLNAQAAKYTGIDVTELTGWFWERTIHPEDLPKTVRDWTENLQTGQPRLLEFRILSASGEYRWHIARQVPSRDAEGRIVRWYGTCTDIEDHKRAEEALRVSEERYRTLFLRIPDPMFVFDPQSLACLAVNDAALEKYGYSRPEFLQMTIRDIHCPHYSVDWREPVDDLVALLRSRDSWQHCKRRGEVMEVEVTAHSLTLDGRVVCIVLCRDVTARRRAEAEVRRTSELLRVVTEGTPDAVFVKDRAGRYLLFNPAAARFVGKPAEEVIGHDDTAIFGPEDAALIMQLDRQVMVTERTLTSEEKLTAAGATRVYLATKAPYRDGDGCVVGTIGISRDITERKQAEVLIAESQQRLQALFNNALNAILLASDDGMYVDANPAACAMLGYGREELLRIPMEDLVVYDTTPASSMWAEFRRDGKQSGLVRLRRKDGQIITAEFSAVAHVLPGVHLSILSDVTERKQAEEAFRKISALHETIIHTAVEGIGLFTPTDDQQDVRFSVWNDQMSAITGYTREVINERGWLQTLLVDPQVLAAARVRLQRLLDGEDMQLEDWEIVRKDGERRVLSISAARIASNEPVPQLVAMMQDVTERRRHAEELAARQAELRHVSRLNTVGQMAAALSHEVAQPLAAIANYAASSSALLANKDGTQLELVRQHIEQITQQSRRAAEVIYRLREYCRKGTPARAECDVNELLHKSVEMLSLELSAANINLEWDLAPRVPAIQGDRVQLQQVFVNLILNARDSLLETAADMRKIALRTRVGPDAVSIDVEDNGIGLTDDVAGQLFEPFVTTKPEGMGIGLSICRSILQEHRGDIQYHHQPEGGVTFRVRLALSLIPGPS